MLDIESITNTILNDDCINILKQLPDKCIDLVLTDPPYGINASSKNFLRQGKQTGKSKCVSGLNYKISNWDKDIPQKQIFEEIKRVSKNQISEVKFCEERAAFTFDYITDFGNIVPCTMDKTEIEVIGNIYENPELLED